MNRRVITMLCMLMALTAVFGCAQSTSETEGDATEATSSEMTMDDAMELTAEKARELGTMAVAMEKDPDRIPELLESHGMTSDDLQAMLVQIAADAELTEAYEAAREAASATH